MNYLPPLASHDKVFRENNYAHKFVFPEGFLDGKLTEVDVWLNSSQYGLRFELTPSGDDLTITMAADQVKKLPGKVDLYIVIDGEYFARVILDIMVGSGDQRIGDTQVVVGDQAVTFVQFDGGPYVAGLVDRAEDALEEIEAVVLSVSDVSVPTYADAVPYFTGNIKRSVFVQQASEWNDPGEFFTWLPLIQKEAHMGIDVDYKEV